MLSSAKTFLVASLMALSGCSGGPNQGRLAQPVIVHDAAVFPFVWLFTEDGGPNYPYTSIAAISKGYTSNPDPHSYIYAMTDGNVRNVVVDGDWEVWVNDWANRINATVVDMRPGTSPTVVFGVYQIWILPTNEEGTTAVAIRPDKIISIKEHRDDPENRSSIRINGYFTDNWVVWYPFETLIEAWSNNNIIDWR
jgi:hypothetical protein